jgi:hypothetical protein
MSTDFFNPIGNPVSDATTYEFSYKKIGIDIFEQLAMISLFDGQEEKTIRMLEKEFEEKPVQTLAEILINYLRPKLEKSYGVNKVVLMQMEKQILFLIQKNLSIGETVDSFLDSIEIKYLKPSEMVIRISSEAQKVVGLLGKRSSSVGLKLEKEKKTFLKRSQSESVLMNRRIQDLIVEDRGRLVEIEKHAFKPFRR